MHGARVLRISACVRVPRRIGKFVTHTIFIIDPSSDKRQSLADAVAGGDSDVRTFASAEDFLRDVTSSAGGCVIAPSDLAGMGIRALLESIGARGVPLPLVVLGRDADLPTAVELVRLGAAEYLEPPVSDRRLRSVVRQTIALCRN